MLLRGVRRIPVSLNLRITGAVPTGACLALLCVEHGDGDDWLRLRCELSDAGDQLLALGFIRDFVVLELNVRV